MLISEAFNQFIVQYLQMKNAAPGTYTKYRTARDLLIKYIGNIDLNDITLEHVQTFHEKLLYDGERRRCSNTAFFNLSALRSVLRFWSVRGEDCLRHELITLPKMERNVQTVLYEDEVQKIIAYSDSPRDKFVISLLFSTGMRLSEVVSLDRGQIHDRQVTIKGKGGKVRLTFTDKRTIWLMNEYLETRDDGCDALIASNYGQRISKGAVSRIVQMTAKNAGITKNVHPHTYRHSFATNFLLNGGSIWDLSIMMGHTSISTTAHYAHSANFALKKSYEKFHTC